MPEAGGKAAFYLQDILNAKELANILDTVLKLNSKELAQRREWGYQQVKRFSRKECAENILNLFQELYDKGE